jgi:DNA invertase Pin-like site-specific DNA recombinase
MGDCVAYMRVSSRAQDLSMQKSAIERAAAGRGDTIQTWYAEKRTGRALARPELDRLRAEVRARRIAKLYVFRLDRLTRSGIADTFAVIEELRAAGCALVTVADGFDLNGPAAEVVLAVMAWASKMERLAIGERIAAARERLEAEGRPWGRPPRLTDTECQRVRALRDEGRTLRQIAMAMKVPKTSIVRALARVA